jgi:hypothetical protein
MTKPTPIHLSLRAAEAGALESPAYARRGLTPKVPIGTKYVPPKFDTRFSDGSFRGYGRSIDADASLVQTALLQQKSTPERRRVARRGDSGWWWLAGAAAVITLYWMVVYVGPHVF